MPWNKILRTLLDFSTHLGRAGQTRQNASDEPPLRAELFSSEQMKKHGKALADSHKLSSGRAPDRLLTRLAENEAVLIGARNLLSETVKANRRIVPAGEWLLDNAYLIEEQIRTAKRHLPKGYSRELPRLANSPSAGFPRVYDIALEAISHGDGRVDPENLGSFVAAYQSVTILKLGELWAIPIMLRLALIENLRRVAARIAAGRIDRSRADHWADMMTEIAAKDPKSLILAVADMARSNPPMVSSFVAEITRHLQGRGPALALPLNWIEQRLSESGLTIDQLVRAENQQQAADQVSMSNSIGSLRFLSAMDWREFVETMSVVDQTLGEDPGDVYGKMDFATRDRYRHVVERTAKRSPHSESEVARQAIGLAQAGAARKDGDDRSAHVGFYLIGEGFAQFERVVKVRLSYVDVLRKIGRRFPLLLYGGAILLVTAIFAGGLASKACAGGLQGWPLGLVGLLLVLCASHLAVALVSWLATLLATPRPLPRMDFSKQIPSELRTLVVVPTMLTSPQNIEDLVEALEVRFLANRIDHLHFALLTDFRDAHEETLPEDEPLLRLVRRKIEALNDKYRSPTGDIFFLFHRPRRWNPRDRIWMGYERKRGKLSDLNEFLRGEAPGTAGDRFAIVVGETVVLSNVKYVITLDTDTQLARDSALQFVGAMAHPLNRARYDPDRQRVVAGYGILQPRVAVSLPGTNRSRYARMCASEPGIDPYTRAVSDVYQDLFGEGAFIGKGIYEVEAFEKALGGRFPDNRILSHDLLEGCYARAGLLSDVQLYEEYPPGYHADVSRRHRWIRGDWQIAQWLLPAVSRARWAPGEKSALDAVPLENRGQPAAQSDGRGLDPPVAVGLDGVAIGRVLDLDGDRHPPDSVLAGLGPERASQARRYDFRAAHRGRRAPGGPQLPSGGLHPRMSAVRSAVQSGCGGAHGLAPVDHAPATAPMGSGGRPAAPLPHGPCRLVSDHVDRPGHGHCRGDCAGGVKAGGPGGGRTDIGPLVCRPCDRLVDQPAAGAAPSQADRGATPLSAEDLPENLGLFRDLCRPGRSLAAAGQLSGTSRARCRASHVTDQHGPFAAGESVRLRFRLPFGRTTDPAHDPGTEHHGRPGTIPGPLLQLVRHPIAETTGAPLHLVGGQRKPCGPSADIAAGSAGAGRSQDPGRTIL